MTSPKKRRTRWAVRQRENTAIYRVKTKKGRHAEHADLSFTCGSESFWNFQRSCGSRIRTDDLEVMSLASYRAAPSRGEVFVSRGAPCQRSSCYRPDVTFCQPPVSDLSAMRFFSCGEFRRTRSSRICGALSLSMRLAAAGAYNVVIRAFCDDGECGLQSAQRVCDSSVSGNAA